MSEHVTNYAEIIKNSLTELVSVIDSSITPGRVQVYLKPSKEDKADGWGGLTSSFKKAKAMELKENLVQAGGKVDFDNTYAGSTYWYKVAIHGMEFFVYYEEDQQSEIELLKKRLKELGVECDCHEGNQEEETIG